MLDFWVKYGIPSDIDSRARRHRCRKRLTLTLKDYAGTEEISDLPKRLSTEGAPSGSDPSIGDITYYALWGNLAIFYRDFGYASGLVILGKIDGGKEAFNVPGSVYAGKDMVALDALCCDLLNVKPREVLYIQLAHESGLGQMNLAAGAIKYLRL